MRICAIGKISSPHIRQRSRAFALRGHAVTFISTVDGDDPELEVVVPPAPEPSNWLSRKLSTFSYVRRFKAQLESTRADIFFVHYATGFGAWLAAATGRAPLVVSVMGGDVLFGEQNHPNFVERWLTTRVVRQADLVISKSAYLTERLVGLGVDRGRILETVWGVDSNMFHPVDPAPLRARLGISDDERVVLSARALTPLYNIHLIVEGFAEVARRCADARLLLLEYNADPEYRRRIEALVERLGIGDRVLFPGQIPPTEMAAFYSLADVAVSVPPSDGIPQVMLEAMACGTPNVLTRLRRYEQLVTDHESAVFVDLDAPSVGAGILELLEDAPLRRRLADRGRAIVSELADFDTEVSRVESALQRLRVEWNDGARPAGTSRLAGVLAIAMVYTAVAIWGLRNVSRRFGFSAARTGAPYGRGLRST